MSEKKRYGPDQPFKNKKEYDQAFEASCKVVADTLKITMDQARVRQFALFESGLMDEFDPNDPMCQFMVDAFMTNPAWDNQPKHFGKAK